MTTIIEKYEIRNRWSSKVQFTAEIEVTPDMTPRVKIGLAVVWGRGNNANLSAANLRGADLRDAYLSGANLSGANLSAADLRAASLRDAYLSGANLSGASLSDADLRGAYLSGANLSGANLSGANLSAADLRAASLRGAVLSGANLSGASLSDADLSGANLSGANLSGAPIISNIHQRVYEAASQPGALNMRDWHTCDTTHCRAGWVVALAGDEGKALESRVGTASAASLIYLASDPSLGKFPSFYCDDATALADMKLRAEQEAAR